MQFTEQDWPDETNNTCRLCMVMDVGKNIHNHGGCAHLCGPCLISVVRERKGRDLTLEDFSGQICCTEEDCDEDCEEGCANCVCVQPLLLSTPITQLPNDLPAVTIAFLQRLEIARDAMALAAVPSAADVQAIVTWGEMVTRASNIIWSIPCGCGCNEFVNMPLDLFEFDGCNRLQCIRNVNRINSRFCAQCWHTLGSSEYDQGHRLSCPVRITEPNNDIDTSLSSIYYGAVQNYRNHKLYVARFAAIRQNIQRLHNLLQQPHEGFVSLHSLVNAAVEWGLNHQSIPYIGDWYHNILSSMAQSYDFLLVSPDRVTEALANTDTMSELMERGNIHDTIFNVLQMSYRFSGEDLPDILTAVYRHHLTIFFSLEYIHRREIRHPSYPTTLELRQRPN